MNFIFKISIPIPFEIQTVNIYLIKKEPITLIDTGMKLPETYRYLDNSLKEAGITWQHIKRVIITHGHVDHFGFGKRIMELSNPTFFVHKEEYLKIKEGITFPKGFAEVLIKNGTPDGMINKIINYVKKVNQFGDKLDKARFNILYGGERIEFDDRFYLKVIHTPGHTPGHICLYNEKDGIIFSGDHLLQKTTPNPLFDWRGKEGNQSQHSKVLIDYIRSLRKIEKLDLKIAFPGHGLPFRDIKSLIQKIYNHHSQRLKNVLNEMDSQKDMTPYQIGCKLFPDMNIKDVLLVVSEILGHLDILLDKEMVKRKVTNDRIYYIKEKLPFYKGIFKDIIKSYIE